MSDLKKKSDILADELTPEKGVSNVGIEIRRADKKNPGVISHGYGRVTSPDKHKERAKSQLKSIINHIKTQPKPNLTRSELEKADYWSSQIKGIKQQKDADRQQKLETHFKAKGQAVPEHLKNPKEQSLDYGKIRQEAKNIKPAAPMAPKTKISAPSSMAPKQVFHPDRSGVVDYKQKKLAMTEKPKLQPASVSEPLTINTRETITSPVHINGPVKLNAYGGNMKKASEVLNKMVGCLKKVDPKTKLPGILIDKSEAAKKNFSISPQVSLEKKNKIAKSDIESFDKSLEKAWKPNLDKASAAPAPAPSPVQKPAAPKMQAPKVKAPQIKQPKAPVMQMSEKPNTMNIIKKMADSIKSKKVMKSEGTPGKKYVTVSQDWTSRIHNKESGKYENPVRDAGKKQLTHMDDLNKLKEHKIVNHWQEHDTPKKMHGHETYEKHPDGKLTFVHAKYDTSG